MVPQTGLYVCISLVHIDRLGSSGHVDHTLGQDHLMRNGKKDRTKRIDMGQKNNLKMPENLMDVSH